MFLQVLCFSLLLIEFNRAEQQSSEEDHTSMIVPEIKYENKFIAKRVLFLLDKLTKNPTRCLRELVYVKTTDKSYRVKMHVCTEGFNSSDKHPSDSSMRFSDNHHDSDSNEQFNSTTYNPDYESHTEDDEQDSIGAKCLASPQHTRLRIKGKLERCYLCKVTASTNEDTSVKKIQHHSCQRSRKYGQWQRVHK